LCNCTSPGRKREEKDSEALDSPSFMLYITSVLFE
jgi:hypothetical protein